MDVGPKDAINVVCPPPNELNLRWNDVYTSLTVVFINADTYDSDESMPAMAIDEPPERPVAVI
jgi:hypothetical protein